MDKGLIEAGRRDNECENLDKHFEMCQSKTKYFEIANTEN